ncbi:hypothetical protein POVCU2_0052640 [Plasmodium ovale curtisi]|uniref:PIR Superfamily Protein n=1 Tax=Plasmodium ovale curtisi TaxID=864141 RepID=A0A1A8W8K3_PLAOA|nr:hypothetical protein POVCU2_0052640 [Plasmodium ovale curtisi]SBT02938.1 hypothetical protein POVCU1_082390 [Plasmodium ovale curtisi]
MVAGSNDKEQILQNFDTAVHQNSTETLNFLETLKAEDTVLHNHGCFFEKAYKYADMLYDPKKPNSICEYINEWLTKKTLILLMERDAIKFISGTII